MAALLVGIAVMAVLMTAAMPAWRTLAQREREAELVFRGQQYARAIGLFQRKYAGAFPPSIDLLVQQKFLRKAYKDPITGSDFQVLYQNSLMAVPGQAGGGAAGAARPGEVVQAPTLVPVPVQGGSGTATAGPRGGVVGVVSTSTKSSLRVYNGRTKYNEWQFIYTEASQRAGPGGQQPGVPGQRMPGMAPGQRFPGGPGGAGRPGSPRPAPNPYRPPGTP